MICGTKLNDVAGEIDFGRTLTLIALLNAEQKNVSFLLC
jgi:hypothetical protein